MEQEAFVVLAVAIAGGVWALLTRGARQVDRLAYLVAMACALSGAGLLIWNAAIYNLGARILSRIGLASGLEPIKTIVENAAFPMWLPIGCSVLAAVIGLMPSLVRAVRKD